MGKNIVLIGNPVAGSFAVKKIERAAELIKGRGFAVQVMLTGKKGDAEVFAREAAKNQSSASNSESAFLIIAAGGDGTYNEVINGIADADIPMAIIPLGTTNVLAKELNISESVDNAVEVALSGRVQAASLGKITLIQNSNSPRRARYFLLMAGIGFDGEAVYGAKSNIKRYSGKGAYVWSGIQTLVSWSPEKLVFNIDGKSYDGYSAIICNSSKYAGHFRVAPDADMEAPYLYVFVMHGRRRLDVVRYVSGILTGRHLRFKDITYLKAKNIAINGNAHIQIDGDYLGRTPAEIEIVPDALKLVY